MSELKLPEFMTNAFPRIKVADWLSEDLKAGAKDVETWIGKAIKAREEATEKMEKLVGDVALMCDTLPSKEEKRKSRLTLLQLDMTARQLAEDFFDAAIKESDVVKGPLWAEVGKAKIAARRAIFEAGFPGLDPDKYPHGGSQYSDLFEQHQGVIDARRVSNQVREFIEFCGEERRYNASRIGVVKAELGKIRDALVREVVMA